MVAEKRSEERADEEADRQIAPIKKSRPQMHSSHLSCLMKCPKQYEFRYVDGLIIPPSMALVIGSSTHVSVEHNLKHKARTGGDMLPEDVVTDIARDAVREQIAAEDLWLNDDDAERGRSAIVSEIEETTISLSKLHRSDCAPHITPVSVEGVERKFVIEVEPLQFDLAGKIDVQTDVGPRDTKTAAAKPNIGDLESKEQFTMYALALHVLEGYKFPMVVGVDALVKTKTPRAHSFETTRDMTHVDAMLATLEIYGRLIKSGVFPPNTTGWWCSRKWCGYANLCKHFSGRR